jgi:hypothetical protein
MNSFLIQERMFNINAILKWVKNIGLIAKTTDFVTIIGSYLNLFYFNDLKNVSLPD